MLKTAKVIFEDDLILVLDKMPGIVVNKSKTSGDFTLQDDLVEYFGLEQSDLGIGGRAGIVHRLDRETSGVIVVAKTAKAFENLQVQFKERVVDKRYVALVHGRITKNEGSVEAKIARIGNFGRFSVVYGRDEGREAKTDFVVQKKYKLKDEVFEKLIYSRGTGLTRNRVNYLKKQAVEYVYLSVLPKTGRTHQIRVHLKSIGNPVVSDLIYGPSKLLKFDLMWCPRLFLHAFSLELVHPKTKKRIKFEAHLPNDLKNAILNLKEII